MDRLIEGMQKRRAIRQWCFRRQRQESEGLPLEEAPLPGLREELEALPEFDGWANFGVTWVIPRIDVSELQRKGTPRGEIIAMLEAPFKGETLMFSLEEQWDAEVRQNARPLPMKRPLHRVISNDR